MSVSLRGMYIWELRAFMYGFMSEGPQHVCMDVWGPPTPSIHLIWMYVCMYAWGPWACMDVCLTGPSKYVCMSEAPEHVCMYVSLKATKSACFGGWQNLTFNSFLFWIVREDTSGSLARVQTCIYVCMYVWESPEHVWGSWACMYVCLTQSYKISIFRRVSNSLSKPFKI